MTRKLLRQFLCCTKAIAIAVLVSSCASTTKDTVFRDTKSAMVFKVMTEKLASARTLEFTAVRTSSPGTVAGMEVAENAVLSGRMKRPGSLRIESRSELGTRTVVYDGRQLVLIDYHAGTYAKVQAPPTLDATLYWVSSNYGFSPPVAELLVNDPESFLLDGVTKAWHGGTVSVDGVSCDRLVFAQPGLQWELCVGEQDSLPRKISQVYETPRGSPPRHVTAVFKTWKLNPPLPASSFVVRIPSGSQAVDMIPLKP